MLLKSTFFDYYYYRNFSKHPLRRFGCESWQRKSRAYSMLAGSGCSVFSEDRPPLRVSYFQLYSSRDSNQPLSSSESSSQAEVTKKDVDSEISCTVCWIWTVWARLVAKPLNTCELYEELGVGKGRSWPSTSAMARHIK